MSHSGPTAWPGAMLTDLYQLTMAYGYWRQGWIGHEAVFHLYFRRAPFGGSHAVACGLAQAIEFIDGFRFTPADCDFLAGLRGTGDAPLFPREFLAWLGNLRLSCDIDALPEGTVVFPHEPLVRVRGPLIDAQLLETALLNFFNFSTLIATKAARVRQAARGGSVLEFGLRRAQGVDGGLTASRAAYVGGCEATSNLLAGQRFGIPVRGTHAHSWVMCFDDEPAAFRAYAEALPQNAVLLVDTYDTLAGVRNAIEAGRALRARGHDLTGIRLDSGDLVALSLAARRLLDDAGFSGTAIVASGDLDEYEIERLLARGARIDVWGVGTRLATANDQPALGGVYKLSAIRAPGEGWRHRVKLSDDPAKSSLPGIQQVRRGLAGGCLTLDLLWDEDHPPRELWRYAPWGVSDARPAPPGLEYYDLLQPVFRGGRRVYDPPSATAARERALAERSLLPEPLREFRNTSNPLGVEAGLAERARRLAEEHRFSPSLPLKSKE